MKRYQSSNVYELGKAMLQQRAYKEKRKFEKKSK